MHEQAFAGIVGCEIAVWDALERAMKRENMSLTCGRFLILRQLVSEPLHVQELARRVHATTSATSRLVDRMVKDGLLTKETDDHDRRAVVLRVTDTGKACVQHAEETYRRCLEDMFEGIAKEELDALCRTLARIQVRAMKGQDRV